MKTQFLPIIPILLVTACAAASPPEEHAALMDEVEHAVILPNGAYAFDDYARNYALKNPTTVLATYIVPHQPIDPSEGCEVLLEDFKSRPCTKAEIDDMRHESTSESAMRAGQRRWYNQIDHLPYILDGGCSQVTIEYDVAKHLIRNAKCNGDA